MRHNPNIAPQSAEAHPAALPFTAGLAVGRALQTFALEGYGHSSLAHRNLEYHPIAAHAAHNALLLLGMKPNDFAASHRRHHATDTIPPVEGTLERLKSVLVSGSVVSEDELSLTDPGLTFPGYEYADDPLLREQNGEIVFRLVPPLEKVVKRGGVYRAAGVLTLAGAVVLVSKAAGSDKPLKTAGAFLGGMFSGVTANSVLTAYKENSAGVTNGQVNLDGAGPLTRTKLRRHARHHAQPDNLETGLNTFDRVGISFLGRLGVLKPHRQ